MADEGALRPGVAVSRFCAPAIDSLRSLCVDDLSVARSGSLPRWPSPDMTVSHVTGATAKAFRPSSFAVGGPGRSGRVSGRSRVTVGGAAGAGRIEPFGRSGRVVGAVQVRGFRDSVTGCDGANVCFAPISGLSPDVAARLNRDRQGPRSAVPRRSRDFYSGRVWTPRPDTDKLAYRYDSGIRGSET